MTLMTALTAASGLGQAESLDPKSRIVVRLAPTSPAPEKIAAGQSGRPDFDRRIQSQGVDEVWRALAIPKDGHRLRPLADNMRLRDWVVVHVPEGVSPDALLLELQSSPDVELAEFDGIAHATGAALTPDDPYFPTHQYSLFNSGVQPPYDPGTAGADIEMEAGWQFTTGDTSTVLAIIDTGVDLEHPEFAGRIWENLDEGTDGLDLDGNGYVDDRYGYDFANNDPWPDDDNKHGSHCAGIAAATGNNGTGVAGINWNCKIMALKVLNAQGSGFLTDVAEGITYAANEGAHVMNLSIGGPHAALEQTAIEYAIAAGVVVCAAMGNDNHSIPSYPAAYDGVISVGATNSRDERAFGPDCELEVEGSNFGPWIDVVAAGDNVWSTFPIEFGSYGPYCLTSMASPHVAGLASLILALRPEYTVDSVRRLIRMSAEDQVGPPEEDTPGWDQYFGFGRINARIALQALVLEFPPIIDVPGPQAIYDGDLLQFTISATDSNFLPPVFSIVSPLPGMSLVSIGEGLTEFQWTPTPAQVGIHVVQFVALDGALADTGEVTIEVLQSCGCPCQCDFDCSGFRNATDLTVEINVIFFGAVNPQDPSCPTSRADFDANGVPNTVDLTKLIDHVFFGGSGPEDPCGL